jgi:YVTN family beta-propeller protein
MQQFGQYRIDGIIGSGGMGEVYRAYDTRRDREVALKLLPMALSDDPEYQRRFQHESDAVARLREPHVVPIHDYGEIDGRLFVDMQLVDGPDLGELVERGGPLSPERAVGLVAQIAEALDAAHANGVVHRDVKPGNVLVTADDFAYVTDFGIAHAVGHNRSKPAMTGATLGTLDYMAPERFESHPVDPRTDVYSLACILFECLTGEKPFPGDDLPALMYAHLYTAPRRVSAVNPAVGTELDAVVAQGMAKNPADRYPSTGALAAAARAAISVPGDQTEQHVTEQHVTEQHVEEVTRRVEAPSESETVIARPLVGAPVGVGAAMAGSLTEPPAPGYAEPRYDDPAGPHHVEPRYADAAGPGYAQPRYDDPAAPHYAEPGYDSAGPHYVEPRYDDAAGAGYAQPRYDDAGGAAYAQPRYDDPTSPHYAAARHDDPGAAPTVGVPIEYPRAAGPPPGPPQPPFGPGGPPPEPPRKSRGRLVGLLAVIALLVAGGAAGAIWFLTRGPAPAPSPAAAPPVGAAPSDPVGPAIIAPPAASVGRSVDTPTVGQTVPANSTPGYMEIAPSGRFAYIANRELGVLSIFDTTRNAVTGTIKVAEGGPQFVAFSPDGKRAYVSIFNNARTVNVIGVLDTATNAFIATIPVGVRPFALDVTPDGKKVYVPNHDSGSITVIDTATNNVINTIKVAPNPHWVDVSADGKTLYAANHESNVVSMIDTTDDKVITTVPVGKSPHSILRHPTKPLLFNVNYDSNSLSVIDTNSNKVIKTVPTASHPQDITLSADGEHIYIAAVDDNSIQVFSMKTMDIVSRVPVGKAPTSVSVSRDGRQAYVTNLNDGTVTILNLAGTA